MQTTSYAHHAKMILIVIIGLFIALSGDSIFNQNQAHAVTNIEQQDVKVIKIESEIDSVGDGLTDGDSRIEVKVSDSQDNARVFTFTGEELDDLAQVEFELSDLDRVTQKTVIDVLEKIKNQDIQLHLDEATENLEQVFILKNENIKATKQAIKDLEASQIHHSDVIQLIGKSSAQSITRMLERGDFTQEQLDEIQRALDSKR